VTDSYHTPVLLEEALRWLDPKPFGTYIDCTVGGGAHAEGMLVRMDGRGILLGLDRDPEAIAAAERRLAQFGKAVRLRRAPFSKLAELARMEGLAAVHGVFFDFGVSSAQLDRAEAHMSYRQDGPLDLRMERGGGVTAADLLAQSSESEIAQLLREYGEEPRARQIARRIAAARPRPATTFALADIVRSVAPRPAEPTLSRVFQALRIAVNRELDEIRAALPAALDLLAPGGRLVAISYHSLEDRLVKTFLRDEERGCICPPRLPACRCGRVPRLSLCTRRAVRPSEEEVARNRRSRSARLRAAERLPDPNPSTPHVGR
jgi:16S rRNA (cytosine1402-N4)-methyltransferase